MNVSKFNNLSKSIAVFADYFCSSGFRIIELILVYLRTSLGKNGV
jgi:hypothetical protein